jgi:hypothetical protein
MNLPGWPTLCRSKGWAALVLPSEADFNPSDLFGGCPGFGSHTRALGCLLLFSVLDSNQSHLVVSN